jgi:hypothetical protein
MEARADLLRRRDRRVFRWSFAIAVVVHGLVLAFGPWFRTEPVSLSATELVESGPPALGGIPVDVFFGPPAIVLAADSLETQPPGRVLRAFRAIPAPVGCATNDWLARESAAGSVRLTLRETGRVETVEIVEGTGDRCWDMIVAGLAGDLLYRWLPSERFPMPVELVQPVTVTLSGM